MYDTQAHQRTSIVRNYACLPYSLLACLNALILKTQNQTDSTRTPTWRTGRYLPPHNTISQYYRARLTNDQLSEFPLRFARAILVYSAAAPSGRQAARQDCRPMHRTVGVAILLLLRLTTSCYTAATPDCVSGEKLTGTSIHGLDSMFEKGRVLH